MKLRMKYHHISNLNKRKIRSLLLRILKFKEYKKYRSCERCNTLLIYSIQPLIFKNKSERIFILLCNSCWNELSTKEKINYYLNRYESGLSKQIVEEISLKCGDNPNKYLRKLKINKICERISL